jgi:hypothetical protein
VTFTVDEVRAALPANLKQAATQDLTDKLNSAVLDPEIAQHIRDNFISYVGILKDGKFKTEDYLNAVTYVSFKLMGYSNREAYEKTFPERMAAHLMKGTSQKDLSAYVAAYAKGRLVNLIYEQTMIPTWVLNQDAYQKAINTQVEIMTTSPSDLARTQAANSVLTHLKKPEVKEFQINIDQKEHSGMKELTGLLTELAQKQMDAINAGTPTALIASQPIVDGEYSEVDADQAKP